MMLERATFQRAHHVLVRVVAFSVFVTPHLAFSRPADATRERTQATALADEQKRLAEEVGALKLKAGSAESAGDRSAYLEKAAQLSMQVIAIDRAMAIRDKALPVIVYQESRLLKFDDLRQGGFAAVRAAAKVLPHNLVAYAVETLVLGDQGALLAHAQMTLDDTARALRGFADGRPETAMGLLKQVEQNPMTLQLSTLAASQIPRAEAAGHRVRIAMIAVELIALLLILRPLVIVRGRKQLGDISGLVGLVGPR